MDSLFRAWAEDRELIFKTQGNLKPLGEAMARAEVEYQKAKARVTLALRADNIPSTIISLIIKGDDRVSPFLFEKLKAETDYDSEKEALNACKLDLRVVEAQIEREFRS